MSDTWAERQFGFWFVFGENVNGGVDISDGNSDVVVAVPRGFADVICQKHNELNELIDAAISKKETNDGESNSMAGYGNDWPLSGC